MATHDRLTATPAWAPGGTPCPPTPPGARRSSSCAGPMRGRSGHFRSPISHREPRMECAGGARVTPAPPAIATCRSREREFVKLFNALLAFTYQQPSAACISPSLRRIALVDSLADNDCHSARSLLILPLLPTLLLLFLLLFLFLFLLLFLFVLPDFVRILFQCPPKLSSALDSGLDV